MKREELQKVRIDNWLRKTRFYYGEMQKTPARQSAIEHFRRKPYGGSYADRNDKDTN